MKGILVCLLSTILLPSVAEAPSDLSESIAVLRSVGREGSGNEEAQAAFRKLEGAGEETLVDILKGMKSASPPGLNWLRSAAELLVERSRRAGKQLPLLALGEFLLDEEQNPRARRFAFELLQDHVDREDLLTGMLDDPSLELRRDAVGHLLEQAGDLKTGSGAASPVRRLFRERKLQALYRQALDAARDVDQIETIVERLEAMDQEVDLPRHFGFLMDWKIIGPFDNTDRTGFERVFPPETSPDPDAEYDGKTARVKWSDFSTDDPYGMVDINQIYGPLKEVTAYALTEFVSEREMPVELRLGCKNAWKVWLNGEFLFGRDEYHRGIRIDQYRIEGRMRQGRNTILVKLCQNEMVEDWTVQWQFQLRVCDENGTAILSADRDL